ncbi:rRNA processing/ribosome biogenesis-domain-containing protein [Xylariomycetidae sp. FL2044]|nr:rRNA processing/ribosome biogenesis-domain-containing protein [Xylariomycetidae sp. FL2044]
MALMALPPELRSICRKLTATEVEQLPLLLPTFLKDVLRCQEPLSKPQEANSPEASVLVSKLRTRVSALLNGRSVSGHFVAVALVKAIVEAGGSECLRTAEPWIRGILSILQKKTPVVIKDLCIVTLTKIFTLMHTSPTLIREIVTPRLSDFATACLQILKPPASSKAAKAPLNLIETVLEALSTLIPLYPTTLRQTASKLRGSIWLYQAPTISDPLFVPAPLRETSRRLMVRLHMTAAKGGDSTEWSSALGTLLKSFHMTADQVLRAVEENWESSSGYSFQWVNLDKVPQGGGNNVDQCPSWSGIQAGSERMIGLLNCLATYLRCRTKVAVTIPVSAIIDLTLRISSIMPPTPGRSKGHSAQMNPAVGREEKEELWTLFPDIQIAVMELLLTLVKRLERNMLPLAQETLDQALRIFETNYRLPEARKVAFTLVKEILCLHGLTLTKVTVEGLGLIVKSCCRDLLGAAGHIKRPKQRLEASQNGSKAKGPQNVDAFLSTKMEDEAITISLSQDHVSAAQTLLVTLFTRLPQQHIPSSLRSQMLKTALLSQNRDAQIASVLHPSRDRTGRTPQVPLPYLMRQFAHDESIEILRFNFRPLATGTISGLSGLDEDLAMEDEDEQQPTKLSTNGLSFGQPFEGSFAKAHDDPVAVERSEPAKVVDTLPTKPSIETPFLPQPSEVVTTRPEDPTSVSQAPATATSASLKRKNEDAEAEMTVSKRVEIEIDTTSTVVVPDSVVPTTASGNPHTGPETGQRGTVPGSPQDEEDSDDESVHLNMELDSDSDDEEEEEGGI